MRWGVRGREEGGEVREREEGGRLSVQQKQ